MAAVTEIDRFAERIASDIARNRIPNLIAELGDLLEGNPEGLFDSLDGLIRAADAKGEYDHLCGAYVALLAAQFEFLRYRIDGGFRDGVALKRRFEERLAQDIRAGRLSSFHAGEIGKAMAGAR
jgi:hypothetical protein